MSAQTLAVIGVLSSIILYVFVSLASAQRLGDAKSFFNLVGPEWRATISLACFNITLGTGVAYVIAQSNANGWFALLTPAALFIGCWALGIFMSKLGFMATANQPNIYYLLNPSGVKNKDLLRRIYSLFLALTFILIVAFELWLGTEFISRVIFIDPSIELRIGVALGLFSIVAIYTSIGGLRGAIDTDIAQGVFIILFLVVSFIALSGLDLPAAPVIDWAKMLAPASILATFLAIATAITTQFYSIVNNTFGPHFTPTQQKRIFNRAGLGAAAYYVAVIFVFYGVGQGINLGQLSDNIGTGRIPLDWYWIIAFAAGLAAISMSTLDNATIAISQVFYENVLNRNSFRQPKDDFWKLRFSHLVVSVMIIGFAMLLLISNSNAFYTLLTILFALSVLSPILGAVMWNHKLERPSVMDNPMVAASVFLALVAAWAWYVKLTNDQQVIWGPAFHLIALVSAVVIAAIDVRIASRQKAAAIRVD
jgi:Na+/proline symporter